METLETQIRNLAGELRQLSNFQQCPNSSGSVVSGKIRDEMIRISGEMDTLAKSVASLRTI
jgi:hypothetical protein